MLHENKYFNVTIRFDHCGDCSLESHIWDSYRKLDPNLNIWFWVNWLSEVTTRPLGRAGHGFLAPVSDKKSETYRRFLEFIGGKQNLHGKTPYYTKFIDEPHRDKFIEMDTPRTIHPPKMIFDIENDPKSNIDMKVYFDNLVDGDTLKFCKAMDKNRWNNFFRRSIIAEIWHLTEILQKDEAAIVVYVGSAKGYCLELLHILFPKVRFLFIDTYSHYISMGEFENYHYSRYLEPNNYITHLALNQSNFNDFYENNLGRAYGVKLFDGKKEIKVVNKYEYLDTLKISPNTIDKYYDYIYMSQNRFFIIEQRFDIDMSITMQKIKEQAVNYGEFGSDSKFIFWTDMLNNQQFTTRSLQNGFYPNYLRTYGLMYIWLTNMKPTHSMLLFRPTSKMEIVDPQLELFPELKEMGYDIAKINNEEKKIPFFKGSIHVSPYMTYTQDYSQLWIDQIDIINNNIVNYDPFKYSEAITYHNIMQRFILLNNNPHADKLIGFDYCNDCAVEGTVWDMYKKKFDKSLNVSNIVLYLSKLYNGKLLDNIHGYMFPKSKEIDVKMYIEEHIKSLIPPNYHKLLKNLFKPRLPRLMITDNDNKLNFFKIEDSKYNNFINSPGRKYLLSGIEHLVLNGPCARWPYRFFVLIYVGCRDDYTMWQLTKIFPNVRILCFEPNLIDIYITKHGNTHWMAYQDVDMTVSYISINKNNIPEDDLEIRPVSYFDGSDELYLSHKNTDEVDTISTIGDITDEMIVPYSNYIFDTDKRVLVFEEELTPKVMTVIKKLVKHRSNNQSDDTQKLYTQQLTLWTNYIPLSQIKEMIEILDPKYVRSIFDLNTKFDIPEFYKPNVYILPWSNRQYLEFSLHTFPRTDPIVPVDVKSIIDRVFYYNLIDRVCYHINPLQDKSIGFDCCGDCALEARIIGILKDNFNLSNEFFKMMNMQNLLSIFTLLCNITGLSTFTIGSHGTLYGSE